MCAAVINLSARTIPPQHIPHTINTALKIRDKWNTVGSELGMGVGSGGVGHKPICTHHTPPPTHTSVLNTTLKIRDKWNTVWSEVGAVGK